MLRTKSVSILFHSENPVPNYLMAAVSTTTPIDGLHEKKLIFRDSGLSGTLSHHPRI
jgi:hypothetical protein